MPTPIRMPSLSPTMDEGKVLVWPVGRGARIERGEVVVLIEADKSEVEIESPVGGFVRHHYAHPGDTVRCGTLIAVVTETADEPFDSVAYQIDDSEAF